MKKIIIVIVALIAIIVSAIIIINQLSIKLNAKCLQSAPKKTICDGIYLGAEFDRKTNRCRSTSWPCKKPPFTSVDECRSICE